MVATSVRVLSTTQLEVDVPVGAVSGPISVSVSGGTAVESPSFTVEALAVLAINSIAPSSGPVGTPVTLTGAGFSANASDNEVTFIGAGGSGDGDDVVATSVRVLSTTQLEVDVPVGAVSGPISVSVSGGTAVESASFTVEALAALTISGISPLSGPVGTPVTLTGTGFSLIASDNEVTFIGAGGSGDGDDVVATSVRVLSTTQLEVDVPVGAVSGPISVSVSGGTAVESPSFTVEALAVLAINSIAPSSGPVGTPVTLTGAGFSANASDNEVTFIGAGGSGDGDDVVATSVRVLSTTQLEVDVPVGAVSGPISVSVSGGTAVESPSFTVEALVALTINNISPLSGPVGTPVTLTGAGFSANASDNEVTFIGAGGSGDGDDVVATSVRVLSTTQLEVDVPVGAVSGPISVSVSGGVAAESPSFTVEALVALAINSIAPSSGPVGTPVTLTGAGFSANASDNEVTFLGAPGGGDDVVATSVVVNSAMELVVDVPVGAVSGPISVSVSGGTAVESASFTVEALAALTISGISPLSGPVGTPVTLTGTGFSLIASDNEVTFIGAGGSGDGDDVVATSVRVLSTTQLEVDVPVGAVSGPISVSVSGGTAVESPSFTVEALAVLAINSIAPSSGPVGTPVTLTGAGFSANASDNEVTFIGAGGSGDGDDVVATSVRVLSTTQLEVDVPVGAVSGPISVSVSGGTAVESPSFTVEALVALTINNISPLSGPVGTPVTLTGAGFSANASDNEVTFIGAGGSGDGDDVVATSVRVLSTTQLEVDVPVGAVSGPISVSVSGGVAAESPSFTVEALVALAINSIAPSSGPVGTPVTLTGAGFSANASDNEVTFLGAPGGGDDVVATSVVVNSAMELVVDVPVGAVSGPISVSVSGGTAVESPSFTVEALVALAINNISPMMGPIGTPVTLTGAGFSANASDNEVTFLGAPGGGDDVVATSVVVNSAMELVVDVPVGAVSGPISVSVSGGVAAESTSFTVEALVALTINNISPLSGLVGTPVTLTGAGFSANASDNEVTFLGGSGGTDDVVATSVRVLSTTQLEVDVPVGAVSGPISVSVSGGTAVESPSFTVEALVALAINNISPMMGPVGTPVTLTGAGFSLTVSDNEVTFLGAPGGGDDVVATSVVVNSAMELVVDVPVGAVSGPISVSVSGGTSVESPSFTVEALVALTINNISPLSGPVGTPVTLTGAGFSANAADNEVTFLGAPGGGDDVVATSVVVNSAMELVVDVPVGAVSGPISVSVSGGTVVESASFTVEALVALTINNISPLSGPVGTPVTLTGAGFSANAADNEVTFLGAPGGGDDVVATSVVVNSAMELVVDVPVGAVSGPISVSVSGGTSVESPSFTVEALVALAINNISPLSGLVGTPVTLTGTGFSANASDNEVTFIGAGGSGDGDDVVATSVVVNSAMELVVDVPVGAVSGPISVSVSGGVAVESPSFTVEALAALTINNISPLSGPVGTPVTLTGAGFSANASDNEVTFLGAPGGGDDVVATSVVVNSAMELVVDVPVGAVSGPISVSVSGGVAAESTSFTVDVVIDNVSPSSGTIGSTIMIAGTGFSSTAGENSVTFLGTADPGDNIGATVSNATDAELRVVVPVGAVSGPISVVVNGGTAVESDPFTVDVVIDNVSPSSGTIGSTIMIAGTGFSSTAGDNVVTFLGAADPGDNRKAAVLPSTSTELRVVVPSGAVSGPISVSVSGGTAVESPSFTVDVVIDNVSPSSGTIGSTIMIAGTGFSSTKEDNVVTFLGAADPGDNIGATVSNATDAELRVVVPVGAVSGPISVVVNGGTAVESDPFTVDVVIDNVSPSSGTIGSTIMIAGTGFSSTAGDNVVTFLGAADPGDNRKAAVLPSTSTELRVVVPSGAVSGPISVSVSGGTAVESTSFTVDVVIDNVSPSSGTIGSTIMIAGTGFSSTKEDNVVTFLGAADPGDNIGATVSSATDTELTLNVPAGAVSGPISVVVNGGTAVESTSFTVDVVIDNVSPSSGTIGFDYNDRWHRIFVY